MSDESEAHTFHTYSSNAEDGRFTSEGQFTNDYFSTVALNNRGFNVFATGNSVEEPIDIDGFPELKSTSLSSYIYGTYYPLSSSFISLSMISPSLRQLNG